MGIKSVYLVAYNAAQAVGWLYVLVLLLDNYFTTGSIDNSYARVKDAVGYLLLGSFLEVVHAGLDSRSVANIRPINRRLYQSVLVFRDLNEMSQPPGLVRSGALNTFMQWLGRAHVWYAVIACVPELQSEPALALMLAAWSCIEIIRYPQNALSTIKASPKWLVWLRYTAFIPLYPAGVLGEVILMYKALPYVKKRSLHEKHFNRLPFDYYQFLWGVLLVYPFLWLNLYLYLFRQRGVRLAGQKKPVKRTSKRE